MSHEITAPYDLLLSDAVYAAELFLGKAATAIDAVFGKGHAAKHPELVVAFMAACSTDRGHSMNKLISQEMAEALKEALADGLGELGSQIGSGLEAAALVGLPRNGAAHS